jgi:hypothetical protein
MGVPLNQWIVSQLNQRSDQTKASPRDTDNIIYQANKTAWIRLVSSIDVVTYEDRKYFRDKGIILTDKSDLAKKFVLQGGTSIYNSENNSFSYEQRSGLSGAYNIAGNTEVLEYGYRPMPGITSVKVTTQGKMGSIRSADIQIKVWDKEQLDIIDALYFKLGYTMFLEWGHTNYYDSNTGKLKQSETFSINPFAQGLTKEKIFNSISRNVIQSHGNYDAMLGMVTNFNFSYNQEGGFDCTIKLMALGVLAGGIKINNPRILPDLSKDVIKELVETLLKIYQEQQAREAALRNPPPTVTQQPIEKRITSEELVSQNLTYNKEQNIYGGVRIVYNSYANQLIKNADIDIVNSAYGEIFLIRRLKGYIPLRSDLLSQVKVFLDGPSFFSVIKNLETRTWESDVDVFKSIFSPTEFVNRIKNIWNDGPDNDSKKNNSYREIEVDYVSGNKLSYKVKIRAKSFGVTQDTDVVTKYYPIDLKEFVDQFKNVLNNSNNQYGIKEMSVTDTLAGQADLSNDKVSITIKLAVPFTRTVDALLKNQIDPNTLQALPDKVIQKSVQFNSYTELTIEDTRFIKNFTTQGVIQPIDFVGPPPPQDAAAPAAPAAPATPPEPPLKVSDIQKSESLKYQSAFEVVVRTIQLYSLNNAINTGIEGSEPKVSKLKLTDPNHYQKFTKGLFSVGLFSNYIDSLISTNLSTLESECTKYDQTIDTGAMTEFDMLKLRSRFGFNFSLLGNKVSAKELYNKKTYVDYADLMTTYTVPYKFNAGVFEGTQVNHPVYIKLGFVLMIINQICNIYDAKKESKNDTPLVYFDFNPNTNTCLSNAKQLSTNPYDILIPFEGFDSDFKSIIDPLVLIDGNYIRPLSGSTDKPTPIFKPQDKDSGDRLSADLPKFKIVNSSDNTEGYRGKTMNILISTDYLLKTVANYTKQDASNDIYAKEFIEQILFDINKYLGDFNMFRLAYDDSGNTMHVTDDQMTPNVENSYISQTNKTEFPLFGLGSLARSVEIRTEVSSKLSNMIAISANSTKEGLSSLSKTSDSFGFYNLGYNDRYIPTRGELSNVENKVTDAMINSAIQFNKAIETYYSDTTPAESSVSHATNYFIERMSRIKSEENGSRASAVIPVSLNFSTDGISGLGMGQAFTVSEQFLPYTYDLSLRDPYGESDKTHTVGFVVVGLDQTIEGNQWISNVRANMMYLKQRQDFEQAELRTKYAPAKGFKSTQPTLNYDYSNINIGTPVVGTKLNYTAEQIKNAVKKKGYTWYESDSKLNIVGVRNSSTKNTVTDKFDDIITVTYLEGTQVKYYQWAITTDPGSYFVKNFFEGGTSTGIMAPGQYINAYAIGLHRSSYEALVEVGSIKAFRDSNKDNVYDETNLQQGNFNMNIHKSSATGVSTVVYNSSAGCQVFSSAQDFNNFMTIAKMSKTKLNSNSFTYTLLTSNDII